MFQNEIFERTNIYFYLSFRIYEIYEFRITVDATNVWIIVHL